MKTELGVTFPNVDFDRLRPKLEAAGATLEQPMRLMRRVVIETPEMAVRDDFLRVRDEGNKVTITYKENHRSNVIAGVKEAETIVGGFDIYKRKYPKGEANQLASVPRVTFDQPIPEIISGIPAEG